MSTETEAEALLRKTVIDLIETTDIFALMNLATKYPNFTPENAREMAMKSVASRAAQKAEFMRLQAEKEENARLASLQSNEETRRKRIENQIDMALCELEEESDIELKLKIRKSLGELWNLVYAKAGVNRPSKSKRALSSEQGRVEWFNRIVFE